MTTPANDNNDWKELFDEVANTLWETALENTEREFIWYEVALTIWIVLGTITFFVLYNANIYSLLTNILIFLSLFFIPFFILKIRLIDARYKYSTNNFEELTNRFINSIEETRNE